ncbi:MAG: fructose-bisphosphatase class II, partial [Candidatus Korobacteraceae bacterium]
MATKVQIEEPSVEHSPTANLETDLALEFLRVVEEAAIASGKTMGQGDRKHADQVATEAMRGVMDSVPMDGTIVIGEGER